jgi:RNA polymerase sigma factor (sigma-70 family)
LFSIIKEEEKIYKHMKNYNDLNDDLLVKLYIEGDKYSMQFLMDKYHPYLFSIAYDYLNNIEETKDILQDTYVKIIENIKKYKINNYFKVWAKTILKNNIINYKKKNKEFLVSDDQLYIFDNIDDDSIQNPVNKFIDAEIYSIIDKEIKQLKPQRREIMNLKYKSDYKVKDIAKKLNISLNTVLTSIHYSIKSIREKLLSKGYI